MVVVAEAWVETEDPSEGISSKLVIVGLASWRLPKPLEVLTVYGDRSASEERHDDRDACPRNVAAFNSSQAQTEAS